MEIRFLLAAALCAATLLAPTAYSAQTCTQLHSMYDDQKCKQSCSDGSPPPNATACKDIKRRYKAQQCCAKDLEPTYSYDAGMGTVDAYWVKYAQAGRFEVSQPTHSITPIKGVPAEVIHFSMWNRDASNPAAAYACERPDGKGTADCLYLKIFTKRGATEKPLSPVLVELHGGIANAMADNSARDTLLGKEPIVQVNLQYRLGAFNLGGSSADDFGALAMNDLQIALQWIQENIASYGGDPNNVIITSGSGGVPVINALLASPGICGQKLFHAAISDGSSSFPMNSPLATCTDVMQRLGLESEFAANGNYLSADAMASVPMDRLGNLGAMGALVWDHGCRGSAALSVDTNAGQINHCGVPVLIAHGANELGVRVRNPARDAEFIEKHFTAVHHLFRYFGQELVQEVYSHPDANLAIYTLNGVFMAQQLAASSSAPVYLMYDTGGVAEDSFWHGGHAGLANECQGRLNGTLDFAMLEEGASNYRQGARPDQGLIPLREKACDAYRHILGSFLRTHAPPVDSALVPYVADTPTILRISNDNLTLVDLDDVYMPSVRVPADLSKTGMQGGYEAGILTKLFQLLTEALGNIDIYNRESGCTQQELQSLLQQNAAGVSTACIACVQPCFQKEDPQACAMECVNKDSGR